jgi:deoxyribonuclease V
VQEDLERHVIETPLGRAPGSIAGVDVSVKDDRVRAAVAVLSYPDFELVDSSVWEGPAPFPYIPGYLSFREVPVLLRALEDLETWPDLFMTDGQGRAHPRRFGLACHLGVLLDMPAIGVAKSRLTGIHEEPCSEKGCSVPLLDPKAEECIGAVVRTRSDVKPVFVSVGHRVTLDQAIELTMACATKYKLPEPTRVAHLNSRCWQTC